MATLRGGRFAPVSHREEVGDAAGSV